MIEHGEIELLVGLDVLRAHRCDISLSKNRMKFHAGGGAKEASGQGTGREGKKRRWKKEKSGSRGGAGICTYHIPPYSISIAVVDTYIRRNFR